MFHSLPNIARGPSQKGGSNAQLGAIATTHTLSLVPINTILTWWEYGLHVLSTET